MKHLANQESITLRQHFLRLRRQRNKFHGVEVFLYEAVAGNTGYAGATGCEALSAFAQVSDHALYCLTKNPSQSSSLLATI